MAFDKEKFDKLVTKRPAKEIERQRCLRKNRFWLDKSSGIAVLILLRLKELEWSKKDLARALKRPESTVDKMVRGQYNFSLSTICKLQEVLDIEILKV